MNRVIRGIRPIVLILAAGLLAAAGLGTAAAQGTIMLRTQFPTQHRPTWVQVQSNGGRPAEGVQVSATYRPGSNVSRHSEIGRTDSAGRVEWTPKEAGIVELSAQYPDSLDPIQTSIHVSVRFASPPASGILIMLVAGILLIGGSIFRFIQYMRSGDF
jgi:hypothetical protein